MTNADGKEISLASLRGRVVVIESYAFSCASCLYEGQQLSTALRQFSGQAVALGLSLDPQDDNESRAAYRQATGATWDLIPAASARQVILDYDIDALDGTIIVSPKGVITYKDKGPTDAPTFEKEIRRALSQ